MQIKIPTKIQNIYQTLTSHGFEAYFVGGFVRDALLNRSTYDIDITTNALPEQILTLFEKEFKCLTIGAKHGTITLLLPPYQVEITTYRMNEVYCNHRKPSQLKFATQLEEDLKRRDFTINAIAYHPDEGFIDPFHGIDDLNEGILRCVGEANKRFNEDALRILRGVRFYHRFHLKIEEKTQQAIRQNANLLGLISIERIRDELFKMLNDHQPDLLLHLKECQLIEILLPDLIPTIGYQQFSYWHCYDVFMHTNIALNHAPSKLRAQVALLFHDIGKCYTQVFDGKKIAHYPNHAIISQKIATKVLKNWHCSNTFIEEVGKLIRFHDTYQDGSRGKCRNLLYELNNDFELTRDCLLIQLADNQAKNPAMVEKANQNVLDTLKILEQMEKEGDIVDLKHLAIQAKDCIAIGLQKRQIKEALDYCIALVLQDIKNNQPEFLIEEIKKNKGNRLK